MLVHRRNQRENDIGREQFAPEHFWHFGKMVRVVVVPASLAAWAGGTAEKVGGMTDVLDRLRIEIIEFAYRYDLRHLYAAKIAAGLGESGQQGWWLTDARRHDDGIALPEDTDRIGG